MTPVRIAPAALTGTGHHRTIQARPGGENSRRLNTRPHQYASPWRRERGSVRDRRGPELPGMPGSAAPGRLRLRARKGRRRAEAGRQRSARKPGRAARFGSATGLRSSLSGVGQRPAHVGDVNNSEEAGVAGHRQVTEMPARHDLGRVTDAVVVRTAGRVVITVSTQTSLTSLPAAIARATSAWVMMPAG